MPRTHPRVAATTALLASGLALGLAGCGGGTAATPTASPPATPSPIFASDEEALAAAEEAYAAYSEMNDLVGSEGGSDVERLRPLVGDEIYTESVLFFKKLKDAELIADGRTRFTAFELTERLRVEGGEVVTAYFCRDVSEVRIIDAAGVDVTPSGRETQQPMLGTFKPSESESGELVVEGLTAWSGDNLC